MDNSAVIHDLPRDFLLRMQDMLGPEYDAFLESYARPRSFGLRVNTAKITCEAFEQIVPFPVRPVPWVPGGYFYDADVRPARCPLYQAGLYYLQEPSAMTPASLLPVEEGDAVLDLCAAPGGKATALGAKLFGTGLLVANDISTSRARALQRNIELFGITSVIVSDEAPERLAARFPSFFDRILLDAPCSGEGMFRKEEALRKDWSPEKSASLSGIQKTLILQAADMLRPGGMLLYSTCTFAPAEDEEVVAHLLSTRPDMELMPLPSFPGFAPGYPRYGDGRPEMTRCVRLFPHRIEGEGHFMALLQKKPAENAPLPEKKSGRISRRARKPKGEEAEALRLINGFFEEAGIRSVGGRPFDSTRLLLRGGKAFLLPELQPSFEALSWLRYGMLLGEVRKNRFEPSQPLALALRRSEAGSVISLPAGDPRLPLYLRGESIPVEPDETSLRKGWCVLAAEGYPLAFGKLVNGTLKNKYPAGWRLP